MQRQPRGSRPVMFCEPSLTVWQHRMALLPSAVLDQVAMYISNSTILLPFKANKRDIFLLFEFSEKTTFILIVLSSQMRKTHLIPEKDRVICLRLRKYRKIKTTCPTSLRNRFVQILLFFLFFAAWRMRTSFYYDEFEKSI